MVSQFIYIPPRSLKHPFHLQELCQLTPTGPCFNACGFCGCSTMSRYQFVESTTEHSHIASRSICVSICMYHDKSSATTHTHGVMSQTSQSHMSHVTTTSMRHSHKVRSSSNSDAVINNLNQPCVIETCKLMICTLYMCTSSVCARNCTPVVLALNSSKKQDIHVASHHYNEQDTVAAYTSFQTKVSPSRLQTMLYLCHVKSLNIHPCHVEHRRPSRYIENLYESSRVTSSADSRGAAPRR